MRSRKSLNPSPPRSQSRHLLPKPPLRLLPSLRPLPWKNPRLTGPPLRRLVRPVFPGQETTRSPRVRACLAPAFHARETTRSPLPREWVAPHPVAPVRAQRPNGPSIVKAELGLLSRHVRAHPVDVRAVPVSRVPAVHQEVDPVAVVPVAVVQEPEVAVEDPEGEPRAPLVAVAGRVNRANPRGRSVKSLKCGRRRA